MSKIFKRIFVLVSFLVLFFSCKEQEIEEKPPEFQSLKVVSINRTQPGTISIKFNQDLIPSLPYQIEKYNSLNQNTVKTETDTFSDEAEQVLLEYLKSRIKVENANIESIEFFENRVRIILEEYSLPWGGRVKVKVLPIVPYWGEYYTSYSKDAEFYYELPKYTSKVANWDPIAGVPQFIGHIGVEKFSDVIGKKPYYLLYDQPLDLTQANEHITVKDKNGKILNIRLEHPKDASQIFGLDVRDTFIVGVSIDQDLQYGEELVLSVPYWKDQITESDPEYKNLNLKYMNQLTLEIKSKGLTNGKMEQYTTIDFNFSYMINEKEFIDKLSIEPRPISKQIYRWKPGTMAVQLSLESGKEYKLKLPTDFADITGNKLSKPAFYKFTTHDIETYFEVPVKPVTIESTKIQLPVKGMNFSSVETRIDNISTSDYIKIFQQSSVGRYTRRLYNHKFQDDDKNSNSSITDLSSWETNTAISDSVNIHSEESSLKREGLKILSVTAKGSGSKGKDITKRVLTNITDIGITAKVSSDEVFFWLSSFSSGESLANRVIQVFNANGKEVKRGKTDNNGMLTLKYKISGTHYILAGNEAILKLEHSQLTSPWLFNLPGEKDLISNVSGSIFTERGVYRPGESVYIKSYLFSNDLSNAKIVVRDPRSKKVFDTKVIVDKYGSSDYKVELSESAAVGRYDIIISNNGVNISKSFSVEEYRVPTFLVNLYNKDKIWSADNQFDVEIESKYYHGGKMDGRSFSWKVTRNPAPLYLPQYPDFIFQTPNITKNYGLYTTGEGVLNSDGKSTVSVVPKQSSDLGRMVYTFEAAVKDTDRQVYQGQIQRVVDSSQLYVGIKKPLKEVIRAGQAITIPFIVSDSLKSINKTDVHVKVEKVDYHTTVRTYDANMVQVLNRKVGTDVYNKTYKSKNTPVNFTYRPESSGIYRLTFSTIDKNSIISETVTYITVTGDKTTAWPRFDMERIDVTRDKEVYKHGDTAILVPNTPYKSGTILVTIETDKVLESKIVQYKNNTPEVSIPIKDIYSPNVYVSMVVIRQRVHHDVDAVGFETGAPGFRIGYTELVVDNSVHRLSVEIDDKISNVSPGESVEIPVSVKNHLGKGVQSQLTVMVVDEAVLNMTSYNTPNPLDEVYSKRNLGIKTGSNWLDLAHSRRERLETIFPGGDEDVSGLSNRSDLDAVLRNLFESTAYWNPDLITDSSGNAKISFTMPDNLTTYRVMVVAATESKKFGSDSHKVISQKALMIQPVIPRFIYTEDELTIEAMVFNNTDKKKDISVSIETDGVTLTGDRERVVSVGSGKSANVPFSIVAGREDIAKIRFKASTDQDKDHAEYELPVMQFNSQVRKVDSIRVDKSGDVTLKLPDYYISDSLETTVEFSATTLTELKGAVEYLMGYPHGCIEQTTSTAYPLVVLRDLLPMIGVDANQRMLKEYAEAGIKRILTFQTADGGLSYWPGGSKSHPFGTAFGAMVLIYGDESGYKVPKNALDRIGDYMESSLRSGQVSRSSGRYSANADTRALYTMLLGRLGRPQIQHINSLWDKRDKLTSFGLSFLAMANSELSNSNRDFTQEILDEILTLSNIEDDTYLFGDELSGGWSMNSPVRTQGAAIAAFNSSDNHDVTQKLIKGLLKQKRGALWGSTQSNVFAIMGIYEAVGRIEDKNSLTKDFNISLNESNIPLDDMKTEYISIKRAKLTSEKINVNESGELTAKIVNSKTPGVLSLYANYSIPMENIDKNAYSNGFTIIRKYEDVNGKYIKDIKLGDIVVIRLIVKANKPYNYVAISDRLPAGLEPINMNLDTSEKIVIDNKSRAMERGLSNLSYQEMRDHMVSFYVDEMPSGEYEYVYFARATTPGNFLRPYANVEAMYDVESIGNTTTDTVNIK